VKLYTVKDVAQILGYREVTIRKKIRDGEIKTTKIINSNAVRVSESEIKRLIGDSDGGSEMD
jgi:excisionase family DNA binding protein